MKYGCVYLALVMGCHAQAPSVAPTTSAILAPPDKIAAPESNEPPRDRERVVASLRPRFRNCYERGSFLDRDAMSGLVVLHMRVAPDGSVRTVEIAKRTGLSSEVATCLSRKAQGAIFEAPGPGGAALDVPVHLFRSNLAAH